MSGKFNRSLAAGWAEVRVQQIVASDATVTPEIRTLTY
ncbi:hypothetical protein SynA18461_00505 [Synechococcus sp. A18-46.1]|nr:hypothetical protein SynA18461_00505 [Synechococcus sp. A18-46.1]